MARRSHTQRQGEALRVCEEALDQIRAEAFAGRLCLYADDLRAVLSTIHRLALFGLQRLPRCAPAGQDTTQPTKGNGHE